MKNRLPPTILIVIFALALLGSINQAGAGCLIAGPDNPAITIEEFADFHCKYCALGAKTMKAVLKTYPNKVKLIFRNLPLPANNPRALTAAKALSAVCLQNPLLAYVYQDELFANQDSLIDVGDQILFDIALKIGVDVVQMKAEMGGSVVERMIAEDQQAANSHNFRGTPSYLIGSEKVVGARSLEEIKQIIEKQLGPH